MNFSKEILLCVEVFFWKDVRTFYFYNDEESLKSLVPGNKKEIKDENLSWFSYFGIHSMKDLESLCVKVCTHSHKCNSLIEASDFAAIAEMMYRKSRAEESASFDQSPKVIAFLKNLNQNRMERLSPHTSWPHQTMLFGDAIVINQEHVFIVVPEGRTFPSGLVDFKIPSM